MCVVLYVCIIFLLFHLAGVLWPCHIQKMLVHRSHQLPLTLTVALLPHQCRSQSLWWRGVVHVPHLGLSVPQCLILYMWGHSFRPFVNIVC